MPQSEAEEMRMFHEALLRSEMEAVQQGVMPQTEAEEQAMLHAALKQSQTAKWHGNINTLDDVSDGDDSIFSGGSSGRESGRSSGTLWHSSINQNSKRQEDGQMSSPQFGDSSSRPNLGGLGIRSSGFGCTVGGDRGASTGTASHIGEGSAGKLDQFDRTVGGKVKGKGRKVPEHGGKEDKAWEFGGSNSGTSFKSDNSDGIQFGFDDEGGTDVKEKTFQTFYNSNYKLGRDEGKKESSNIYTAHAQTKTTHSQNASGGQMGPGQTANNRPQVSGQDGYQKIPPQAKPNVRKFEKTSTQSDASYSTTTPVHQDSLYKSSHMTTATSASASAATSASMSAIINDMDDIDDVDTCEETSAASFSFPSSQPASSFSLDIPSAMCNKERMKSYYSKKK
ncbi:secreted protein C-like isoform X2 [Haliotis rubra]|uniref:secreted protein C-like isoform X2 n=1 Tax=Haliotis rubra TaxID=36100 RepID=UPI001EE560D7|nr:secreted protein C-like isoform X2 [Haliotis rubra]